ncbi:MAG: LysR family transcriptional regulator [Gammaproteobacteria bacterium]
MDIEQIRTFLSVAANGSFQEAANRLYVTQSTVSTRIQRLEMYLRVPLFVRNRSGAHLTQQGRRFLRHAKALLLTLEQARHEIGLPSRFRASITVGARIALWEEMLPLWIGEIRRQSPDVSIRCDIGFEEDLMRRLTEGSLDIGLMYTPQYGLGLKVEHLFDETLALLTTHPDKSWPDDDYVHVDWGPAFYAQHRNSYPDLERPGQAVNIGWLGIQLILCNGGSCYLPVRMAEPFIRQRKLFHISGSPQFKLPAYMVYPLDSDCEVLSQVLEKLRSLGQLQQQKSYLGITDQTGLDRNAGAV